MHQCNRYACLKCARNVITFFNGFGNDVRQHKTVTLCTTFLDSLSAVNVSIFVTKVRNLILIHRQHVFLQEKRLSFHRHGKMRNAWTCIFKRVFHNEFKVFYGSEIINWKSFCVYNFFTFLVFNCFSSL